MAKKGKINKKNTKDAIERPVRYRKYLQFFLIVCEDESTEPFYFEKFRALFPEHTLFLKTVGTGRDPLGVVKQSIIERDSLFIETKKEIDFVWAVFDKDDADENKTKVENFEKAFEIAAKENISIAYSNEVFELWLLLHFKDIEAEKPIPRKQIYANLELSIKEFDQTYAGFIYEHGKKDIIDLVNRIGNEGLATVRAQVLLNSHKGISPIKANPSTRMHILVKELRDWIAYYNWKPSE